MAKKLTFNKELLKILILSDTHVLQPKFSLPPKVRDFFIQTMPDLIIHCGDVCNHQVISELEKIANVLAVRGNRDILNWFSLPSFVDVKINDLTIHAEHGQGNFRKYWKSKIYFTKCRLRNSPVDYRRIIPEQIPHPEYDIYCFGHTHKQYYHQAGNTIFFNPGHLNFQAGSKEESLPGFCLLEVSHNSADFYFMEVRDGNIFQKAKHHVKFDNGTDNA